MRRAAPLGALALAGLVAACAHLDPADTAPRSDPVARLAPAGPSPWRVDFGDPELAALLRDADAGSLDVKIALARLARARADVAAAHAQRSLHIVVGADAAAGGDSFHDARTAATPTFEASYEIDLWGRLARAEDAAAQDRAAAEAEVSAARLSLAAETVRAFAALRAAQESASSYARRVSLAERGVVLSQVRAAEGAADPQALAAAAAALEKARDGLEGAREEVALQSIRLADLTGRPSLALDVGAVPQVGPAAAAASDVVAERPDVQAALARLRAADARRAEAVAASRPQLAVGAVLGAPDAAIANLLGARTLAWAAAVFLTDALVDGGAASAHVRAVAADADVADLQYRKAIRTGWSEVRGAAIDGARARRDLAAAAAAFDQARRGAAVTAARRREGLADGLDAVAADTSIAAAEDQLRTARLNAVEARVRLALATGGL